MPPAAKLYKKALEVIQMASLDDFEGPNCSLDEGKSIALCRSSSCS